MIETKPKYHVSLTCFSSAADSDAFMAQWCDKCRLAPRPSERIINGTQKQTKCRCVHHRDFTAQAIEPTTRVTMQSVTMAQTNNCKYFKPRQTQPAPLSLF